MKYYGLYKITNLTNGKMYIGQHVTSNLDDGYMGSGSILNHAINKYGKENFKKEWLGFYEDKEELNYMERVFVDQTWIDRADTYNLKVGGIGGSPKGTNKGNTVWRGRHHTEQAIKKLSEARKGAGNPMYGKSPQDYMTPEQVKQWKANLSNSSKSLWKNTEYRNKVISSQTGKKVTDATKMKCRKAQLGMHWWNNGKVSVRSKTCPYGFVPGKLKTGIRWYTNGITSVMAIECPEGFKPGRTRKNGVK